MYNKYRKERGVRRRTPGRAAKRRASSATRDGRSCAWAVSARGLT